MSLRTGTPEEAGVLTETNQRIRTNAESWIKQGGTPAVVLLAARKGVIFLHEAFGQLTPEEDSPKLRKSALFPLASLTKPITATAVMILVEDGLIGLNRPVQEYIPEFTGEGKEAVMVHHLLTHTSGLNDEEMFALMEKEGETADIPTPENGLDPMVNKFLFFTLNTPLQRPPGQVMNYSDSGYYIAGEIIHRVSGVSLEQFTYERIFGPLGMNDSTYVVPKEVQDRVVRRPDDAIAADLHTIEMMERPSPSSGVYSTALDMARFGQMFLNGGIYGSERVLSPATVAVMTRDHLPGMKAILLGEEFPNAGWGLGWSIAVPHKKGRIYGESLPTPSYFNHDGYGGVEMWVDPVNEIVGVYFSVALEEDSTGYALHDADLFMNMVTAGIGDGAIAKSAPVSNKESSRYRPDTDSMTQYETRWKRISQSTTLQSGTAEDAGVDPLRVNRLVEQARGWVESGLHPALAIIAARHGVIFLNETFGRLGPEKDAPPLTPDTLFPLTSLTKPITATAVMILVEEGLLSLNRPVREYIPEFQGEGKDRILIRHLLTHTSGLRHEDLMQLAMEQGMTADSELSDTNWASLYKSFDDYLDLVYLLAPSCPPDQNMFYATCNYDLLGEVIGRVSRTAFSEFVRQRILEPLGMQNTFLPVSKHMLERVVRRPETALFHNELSALLESGCPSGGGGFFGTALDLAIFGQMFLIGGTYGSARILSPASVAAMTRDQIPGIEAFFGDESFGAAEWGLGWSVHETKKSWAYDEPLLSIGSYCHGGAGGVFTWVDPAQDLVAVFFSVYLSLTQAGQPVSATDLFINSVLASVD